MDWQQQDVYCLCAILAFVLANVRSFRSKISVGRTMIGPGCVRRLVVEKCTLARDIRRTGRITTARSGSIAPSGAPDARTSTMPTLTSNTAYTTRTWRVTIIWYFRCACRIHCALLETHGFWRMHVLCVVSGFIIISIAEHCFGSSKDRIIQDRLFSTTFSHDIYCEHIVPWVVGVFLCGRLFLWSCHVCTWPWCGCPVEQLRNFVWVLYIVLILSEYLTIWV